MDLIGIKSNMLLFFFLSLIIELKSLSQVWLFVTPKDCSLPGSSIYGIFQARVLEWGAIALFTKEM